MNQIKMDANLSQEDRGVNLSLLGHRNHRVQSTMYVTAKLIHIIQVS